MDTESNKYAYRATPERCAAKIGAINALVAQIYAEEWPYEPANGRLTVAPIDFLGAMIPFDKPEVLRLGNLAWRAYQGSIDSAIILAKDLFPDWDAMIHSIGTAQMKLRNKENLIADYSIVNVPDKPARALLIAVLEQIQKEALK